MRQFIQSIRLVRTFDWNVGAHHGCRWVYLAFRRNISNVCNWWRFADRNLNSNLLSMFVFTFIIIVSHRIKNRKSIDLNNPLPTGLWSREKSTKTWKLHRNQIEQFGIFCFGALKCRHHLIFLANTIEIWIPRHRFNGNVSIEHVERIKFIELKPKNQNKKKIKKKTQTINLLLGDWVTQRKTRMHIGTNRQARARQTKCQQK